MDLTGANHIPDLEEHEEVENPSDVARVFVTVDKSLGLPERLSVDLVLSSWGNIWMVWVLFVSKGNIWLWDEVLSPEYKHTNNDELIDTHVEDMLSHLS